jgi:hypothetical protein
VARLMHPISTRPYHEPEAERYAQRDSIGPRKWDPRVSAFQCTQDGRGTSKCDEVWASCRNKEDGMARLAYARGSVLPSRAGRG